MLTIISSVRAFQSSPALSGRCNTSACSSKASPLRFNPHRPFRAGATTQSSRLVRSPASFNPHRPFRAGATLTSSDGSVNIAKFQSSPALSGRCNTLVAPPLPSLSVSILTGPFGPVQRVTTSQTWQRSSTFQSSPALSGRCNTPVVGALLYALRVSILTGPFGPVQRRGRGRAPRPLAVSILTGPFGPVQRYR